MHPNLVAEHDFGTKLARALGNAGRGVEAADAYRAVSVGISRREQIDRQSCAVAQLIRSGHIDHGLVVLRGVLSDIGFKLSKTPGRALWLAIIYRIRLRLRGLHFRDVAEREIHPDELRRIDICWSVSTALGMIDNIRGADFSACNLLLALRAGEPYRIARALTIEVAYSAGTSWGRDQAARLLERAEALARRLDHSHALGMVTMAKGVSRFLAGDWPSAREFCDLAEDTFRDHCTGVAWELDTTHTISLWSLFFMGDIARLKTRLPNLIREANERGNLYAKPEQLLREAERDARLLGRAKAPWSKALAKVIRASIAANRGDNQFEATLLDAAATACDSANMRLFATATRRQLGGLIGNDQGRTLVTAADDFRKEQGIQDSVCMTNMLVLGFSKSPNR